MTTKKQHMIMSIVAENVLLTPRREGFLITNLSRKRDKANNRDFFSKSQTKLS